MIPQLEWHDKIKLRASSSGFDRGVALACFITRFNELFEIKNIELNEELYKEGVRPTEMTDSNGELRGTKYHLEDMRKLVFKNK